MLKKSILLMSLVILGQAACGSLVSIKGPSVGASACGEGEVQSGVGTGGISVWPLVEIEGPGVNKCVSASGLSMDNHEEEQSDVEEEDVEIAELE